MQDRLIINGDGTVTDSETGLMWTVSLIGKSSDGEICEGGEYGFYWKTAAKLFGRGRTIYPDVGVSSSHWDKSIEKEITQNTYEGYKFSKVCPIFVGGYNDWRLPTLEESWTLVHKEYGSNNIRINEEVFGIIDYLWTASYIGFADTYYCAWLFGGNVLCGDISINTSYRVRLVRGGSVFNSTFGQRKDTFQIRNDNTFIAEGLSIPIADIRNTTIKKVFAGKLLEVAAWILIGVFLFILLGILLGLILFDSFWVYILIPVFAILAGIKAIELLQEKFFYALQIVTSYKQFYLKAEKDKLKVVEQAIKTAKVSKAN